MLIWVGKTKGKKSGGRKSSIDVRAVWFRDIGSPQKRARSNVSSFSLLLTVVLSPSRITSGGLKTTRTFPLLFYEKLCYPKLSTLESLMISSNELALRGKFNVVLPLLNSPFPAP